MAKNGMLKTCIFPFVFVSVMAGTGVIMLQANDAIRRTDWESMSNGWNPAPMTSPSKIILLKTKEESEGGGKKDDKLDMLLPIIMSLGPIILMAILIPIFMSLLSGIMSFVKSLLSMKMSMMPMMPATTLMMGNGGMTNGVMPIPGTLKKQVIFARENKNLTFLDGFPLKAEDMLLTNNMSALQFPGL